LVGGDGKVEEAVKYGGELGERAAEGGSAFSKRLTI